ncbi:fungal-specific transcription factor domain-containing protein [Aspergillus multicolor]|uniref:transcription factor domain-containing protein n=1 Tax=Aspergillus multicolor TaxID=41759 RepID=UPI003CCC9285
MTGGDSSATPTRSFRVRACDNCRHRKIKCDKGAPCSSCNALGISCSAGGTTPLAAVAVAAPAATISTAAEPRVQDEEYEQRFQTIQAQLNSIQRTLAQMAKTSSAPVPASTANATSVSASIAAPAPAPAPTLTVFGPSASSGQTVPPFEGQSSFHHETLVARDAALSAVVAARGGELNDQVSSALLSLKDSLDSHMPAAEKSTPSSEARAREPLLPVDLVVAVVKKVKVQPPFYLVSQSWKDPRQLESLCQSIYFPLQPIPSGSTTLLHGLLYYIIRDYMHEGDPDFARFDLPSSKSFCEQQFSAGLDHPQMLSDPTLEKVQALLIGTTKAQEESNVQRCWTYLSLAFNMCQMLGLHRNATTQADPFALAELKRHAFWSLYTVDKNVSLNIGVTSHFQDHDIDTALYSPSADEKQHSWDLINLMTVEFATIQGKVYDQLYSISAVQITEEEKMERIRTISADLLAVRNRLLEINVSPSLLYADSLHGMTACADFIAYSVLTVIYRAQTQTQSQTQTQPQRQTRASTMAISSQCYEAACLALNSHLKAITYFRDLKAHKQAEYVNSILLYPSFTPFVIVFTHAITTSSQSDLALLNETVHSLDLIKRVSHSSAHLHSICASFARAAHVLVTSGQALTGLAARQDGSLVMAGPGAAAANSDDAGMGSGTGTGGDIALPDVHWPEDLFGHQGVLGGEGLGQGQGAGEFDINIGMFLNDFIGTGRSAVEILRGGVGGAGRFG